jgi:hypothetical protein
MGSSVVTVIGFDLAEAQVGDIAIKTTHNGFIPTHKLGLGCKMDQVDGKLQRDFNISSISQHTLHKDFGSNFLKIEKVPIVGDI